MIPYMSILQCTTRTYATYATAVAALTRAAATVNLGLTDMRYLIAAHADGRFAPVVLVNQPHLSHADVVDIFAMRYKILVIG